MGLLHDEASVLRKEADLLDALERANFSPEDVMALIQSRAAARDAWKAVHFWASRRVMDTLKVMPGFKIACEWYDPPQTLLAAMESKDPKPHILLQHVRAQGSTGQIVVARFSRRELDDASLHMRLHIRIRNIDKDGINGDWYWDLWLGADYLAGGHSGTIAEVASAIQPIVEGAFGTNK